MSKLHQEGTCGRTCRPGFELSASTLRRLNKGPKELYRAQWERFQIRKASLRRYLSRGVNEGKEQAILIGGESAFLAKGTIRCKGLGTGMTVMSKASWEVSVARAES